MSDLPIGGGDWGALDDTVPAGPYLRELDESALRIVALAAIQQAVRDARRLHHHDPAARLWLSETASVWLRWMGISRAGGHADVYQMLAGCSQPALPIAEDYDKKHA